MKPVEIVLIAFTAFCGAFGIAFALCMRRRRKKAVRFYEMAEAYLQTHDVVSARQALHSALKLWCLDPEGRRIQKKYDAALLKKILARLLTLESENSAAYTAVLQASHAADKLAELLESKSRGWGRAWVENYQAFQHAKALILGK